MRINCQKINKILSWLTTITLILQVVLPVGLFDFPIEQSHAAVTVVVDTPTGATDWDIGDIEQLQWTTDTGGESDPDYFALYYSEDNGSSYNLIDGNEANSGPTQSYMWEIPVVNGAGESDFMIKVEAYYNPATFITMGVSATFRIDYGPVTDLALTASLGSVAMPSSFSPDTPFTLTATAKDQYANTVVNYNTSLSLTGYLNGASAVGFISPITLGNGSTTGTWSNGVVTFDGYQLDGDLISFPGSNSAYVEATDGAIVDTTATFDLIENGAFITTPVAATSWQEGTTQGIVFRAGGLTTINHLKVYYSGDSGSSWNSITNNLAPATMPQTYTWSIPTPLTHAGDTSFQIKVDSYDSGGSLIASDTSDTFRIINTGGGGPQVFDTEAPTSKVIGILNSSGGLVSPMPVSVLTSRFTIVAEASDTGTPTSGVDTVALYWGREPGGPYANYGNATTLNIAGVDYYSWQFDAPENDRYYFYSLALDNADNQEWPPKSFWTGIITYDDTTVVDAKIPKILGTVPLDKQEEIGINTSIRVLFDYTMDKASVEQAFSVKRTSDGFGNFRWNAVWSNSDRTVIFSPILGQLLNYDTDYTAYVNPVIAKSVNGEPLALLNLVPNPWTFRTAKQTSTNLSTSTKIPDKDMCAAGDTITYTIVITNSGTATARVTFTDAIPTNTTYNNYVSGATWDPIGNRIYWNGNLARNRSQTIRFRVTTNTPLLNDTRITNEARISDGINPTISRYAITIINSPLGDIISTTPVDGAKDIANTTAIRIVFSQTMNRASVEQAFKVSETLSGNIVPGWIATWSDSRTVVFSLPLGQTLKYLTEYTVLVDQTIADTLSGAGLQETTTVPNPFSFTTAAQRVPDITLSTKISNVDKAQPGDTLTYTVTLTNRGTATANITFRDPIPVDTVYANYVRYATYDAPSNSIIWSGTLAVNASRTITFRVRINLPLANGTMITNAAEINDGFNPTLYRYATTLVESPLAQILSTAPRNGEVNVAIRLTIQITFDQTMDRATTQSAFSLQKVSGEPMGVFTPVFTWLTSDTVLRVTLATGQQLDYNSIYSAYVDPSIAKTRKGAPLSTVHPVSNPWTFTTAEQLVPDLSGSSKPAAATIEAGQRLTYTITLVNSGQATANVGFQDFIPTNTTFSSVRNATRDAANNRIYWNGTLAVNATRIITLVVTVNSPLPNGTVITNVAEINDGFNPTILKYAETIVQSPLSQLLITSPMNGETNVAIQPTIRMTFSQPMDRVLTQSAFSLTRVDGINSPLGFVYAWGSDDTVFTVTLATGQQLEYSATYEAKVDPAIARTKKGATIDPSSPAANPWRFDTVFLNIPNLSTSTKSVDLLTASPGSVLLYTIVLRNTSDFTANMSIEDYIPANTVYNFYSSGGLVYNPTLQRMSWGGILARRSSHTMTFQVKVDSILPNGIIILNEVQINDGVNPIFSKFAETYIEAHTDFSTSYKSAVNDNPERPTGIAQPGDILTFTITVNNTGDMDAVNTLVTDLVPPNTAFVEGSASSGFIYDVLTRTLKWLGIVPVQTGKALTFKAMVDANKDLFQPPNDKVINDAVISDTTNSFAVKSSTTIVPGEDDDDGDGGHHPNNPPYLMEVEPIDGSKSIKLYSPITLKFSENIWVSSLKYIVKIGEQIIDTSEWKIDESESSATITIRPGKPLASGQTYTVQVTEALDMDGEILATDGPVPNNTFSFSTARPMLYFVNKQILTFKAGTISEAIKVKLGDWLNYDDPESTAPIYADYAAEDLSGISIQLWGTSATGRFDVSPTGNFEKNIIHIIMPQGSSEITFYYTDSQVNAPLIYKMVVYAPYTSYLVYGDLRYVSTTSGGGGGDTLQNRIQFITESQNIPVNFFSNPIEFEILSPDGAVIPLEAGKIFLLNTISATGTFYNSFKLPLDNPVNYEGRNYYQLAVPSANTKATFYYKDSTPGPYEITVKESGVTSVGISDSPAVDATQLITIVPLKDQDWDEDVLIKNIVDDSGRKLSYIVVVPDDVVLLPGAKQTFRAKGYDTDGKLIESLEFGWYVISGGGTIRQPYIGSSRATFTAGRTAGIYYDTVLAAAMYNGDLQGGYATIRVADVVDYGGPGHLPSTGPNGIQMIFILLMLFSAVALAEVEHYERTHFRRMAKPKGIK